MTAPLPFADDVHAVAAHHGIADQDVVPAPAQGQVNVTVFLGDELVLRIPRSDRAAALLAKEAEVIPLVREAGVPTPALIAHDASRRVAGVPYVVLERVHGPTLAEQQMDDDPAKRRRALGSLGEILVTLHRIRRSKVGSIDSLPEPYTFSPVELLQELLAAGEIGSSQHDWLLEQFARLGPEDPSPADPVLVHRDITPSNLITDQDGAVTTLLDWGLAEWGPPARDLVGLPIRTLPDLLTGYRSACDNSDLDLESDALRLHLYLALTRLLKKPSTSEDRNWAAPRNATLLDLLAFVSDAGSVSWPNLLRRQTVR